MKNPRIITGIYKSAKLEVPLSARPITDRMKTTLFDLLQSLVENSTFCDLYAGSGSVGFEALSRAAHRVVFVDNNSQAINILKQNAASLGVDEKTYEIVRSTAQKLIVEVTEEFDIVFIDPPFDKLNLSKLINIANVLKPNGIAVFKLPSDTNAQFKSLQLIHTQKFGKSKLEFYNKSV